MRKIGMTLTLIGCTLAPMSLLAEDAAASRLEAILNNVSTYQAKFQQKIMDANGLKVSTARGSMSIARPNQFIWRTEAPDQILVIADGRYLWNYDIDLAQVTQQDLAPVMQNSPAGILAGDAAKLTQTFDVRDADQQQCQGTVDQCFKLLPRDPDAAFSEVVLGIKTGKLVEIRMRDALGQDVQTRFTQAVLNEPISQKQFTFKPPKGVDVINQAST